MKKEEPKQDNCCTPVGQIKRYIDCKGCNRKPKQETIEETAKRLYEYQSQNPPYTIITPKAKIEGFIEGVKWQQEQDKKLYSEDEVLSLLNKREDYINSEDNIFEYQSITQWFKQFKKK